MAAIEDIKEYRVSNALVLFGIFMGACIKIRQNGYIGILQFLVGILVPILILWTLFRFHMIGAGDIKLFSVLGGFYDIYFVIKVFIAAMFFGAVMSLFQLWKYRSFHYRLRYLAEFISNYIKTGKIVPYYVRKRDGDAPAIHMAVAVFAGFLWVLFSEVREKGGIS